MMIEKGYGAGTVRTTGFGSRVRGFESPQLHHFSHGYTVPVERSRDGREIGAAAGGGNLGTGTPLSRAAAGSIAHGEETMEGKRIECRVKIQGCREWQPGVAVGRMGKQLLVQYRTKSGREPRERWFPPHRYQLHEVVQGFVPTLTQYKRKKAKTGEPYARCEECGRHQIGATHSHIVNAETGEIWS